MKLLLIFAAAILACRAELEKEFVEKFVDKVKNISDECVKETKATEDDVNTFLGHEIPKSKEGKCLIFCFHKHFKIQDEDGSLDKEGAIEALEPVKEQSKELYDNLVKVFNTCSESAAKDDDPCLFAVHLAECAMKEGKNLGLDDLLITE